MAQIKWVRRRLENWARWCSQTEAGSLGYPKQSAFARLGAKSAGGEAIIPLDSLDASEINQAVESFKLTQSHLYLVLTLTYAKSLPRHLVAKKMCRAESTVKRNLDDADIAVARWLSERKRDHERLRACA
jgi:hypothetical protein